MTRTEAAPGTNWWRLQNPKDYGGKDTEEIFAKLLPCFRSSRGEFATPGLASVQLRTGTLMLA